MPDTTFVRPDGKTCPCYFADVQGVAKGNIIVVQEYWGLNDNIRRICDKFAEHGYRAIGPDLYHGKLAVTSDEAAHSMKSMDWG